ncbi:tetratricopeptide repeat protein [Pontibacter mangrovi]|uniref:Tetratricopeptide repeat protein n=1 Tax=Pontibacter mangrovi TaxID=2589816 RepID=A0A501VV92_9BACT|nr:tetratricopeptide repeat protein [Pontibacter mangrovi]TPE40302.1 tetratricopeptide repeat protein [Pontibacter mangrovi]
MRDLEKFFWGLLAAVTVLALTGVTGNTLLTFVLWAFGITFAIGGYWLFSKYKYPKALSILAGIAMGAASFMLPWGIVADQNWLKMLLFMLPNLCLFLFLLIYTYRGKGEQWFGKNLQPLLIRSAVLAVLTTVFASVPINTWAHRQVLWAFNQQNESLLHNLRMFDERDKAVSFLDKQMCDAAIKAANAARREGELWLEWKPEDGLQELYGISGALATQYNAYLCKGWAAYDTENYQQALHTFIEADSVLDDLAGADSSWNSSKVWSWKNMADCHAKLLTYEKADSLYLLAINKYKTDVGKLDESLADLFVSLSMSVSAQGAIHEANQVLEQVLVPFESKYKEGEGSYKGTMKMYEHFIANLLRAEDYEKAALYLQKGKQLAHKDSLNYYVLQHYDGYLQLKTNKYKRAVLRFEEAMAGYTKLERPGSGNQVVIRQALFSAYMALADYTKAEAYLQEALEIAERDHGVESALYYKVLLDAAQLDRQLGKYDAAKEKLTKVLRRYESQWGDNNKVAEVLAQMAVIENELDNRPQAAAHATRAYAIARWFPEYKSASSDEVLLNIADVNLSLQHYTFADSLYKAVLERSQEDYYKVQKAKALSGIALVEMEQGQYKGAGEKLEQAIKITQEAVGGTHPMLSSLYYNRGRLKLTEGKTEDALQEAGKARQVLNRYFAADHINQADMYTLQGDIMLAERNAKAAGVEYRKAETIYEGTYKKSHWKRRHVAEMLELVQALQLV